MSGKTAKRRRRQNAVLIMLDREDASWFCGWLDALMASFQSVDELNSDMLRMETIKRDIEEALDDTSSVSGID
jgi:hypothetical protein